MPGVRPRPANGSEVRMMGQGPHVWVRRGDSRACGRVRGEESSPIVHKQQPRPLLTTGPLGASPDGQPVQLITLRNAAGIEVRVVTYGGTILSLKTPDRAGAIDDIVLGFDTLEPYLDQSPYSAASSAATATASRKADSRSTARHARRRPTTRPIIFTAAKRDGTRSSGPRPRSRMPTASASS